MAQRLPGPRIERSRKRRAAESSPKQPREAVQEFKKTPLGVLTYEGGRGNYRRMRGCAIFKMKNKRYESEWRDVIIYFFLSSTSTD